ncbi:ABC transporter permease [Murimonas intestini]|uniref:Aldouronate transport system permease protein n=1 Tax=Murimonas intestini TaxID=1337051 RepID=A0AB73T256_9FIRM|nr:ABC transporter permease subunit [Murimonas intestini]MCR1841854.1 ABC transporter permease subunit [Murimonas intestini]MCR1865669.1 ABC transporter permease subunit [Murimonas intestini]MCR1886310.1 ABC transporter permease subunit [Murimonas intestini]
MKTCAVTAVDKKRRKAAQRDLLKKQIKARWQIYLLLLLPLAYILIFAYIPMGGLVMAFKDYDMTKGIWGSDFVGLANFQKFFSSYKFTQVLKNTLTVSVYSLLITFPVPIIFALILNSFPGKRFNKVVQTTTYIPYFISTVVMVGLVMQVLNYRTGIYGALYSLFTGKVAPDILGKASSFKHVYVWSSVWQTTGYSAIIYIAALANVDPSLHEAAKIDGASRFQRVRYVDWPSIMPTATIMLILAAGNIMNVGFEKVLLLQNDLNIASSEVISTYVYKVGLARGIGDFSLSTAIGMFNSVINFVLLVSVNWLSKRLSGNGIF